jgi:predicted alpha-1,2-mannosidase
MPFGFNFWTPITEGNSDRWLYNYQSGTIQGFAVSHEPSPWISDHGSIQIMPMFGELRISPEDRASTFDHAREIARAHYYRVALDTYEITTEIAPTDHASAWKFTFSKAGRGYFLFDSIDSVTGNVSIDSEARAVQGYIDHNGPRLYFFSSFDKSLSSSGIQAGPKATGWVQMDVQAGETIAMTMGTSFISVAQARANLNQEVGDKTFDQIKEAAASVWDKTLGKIEIEGATEDQRVTFYSNMYRSFLYPNSMWETVGQTTKYFSPYTMREAEGKIYVNGGFWDTYRAAWPLYSLLVPSHAAEMLEGFVTAYKDGGWTPRWSGPGYIDAMVGTHSDIVFADAYLRGVAGFDINTAYESMLKNALVYSSDGARGRKGNERSIFRGYVASDRLAESAAWTLEDAINDYGIAQVAQALGDKTHFEYFLNRSRRYANLFSPSVGFFRGKNEAGDWRTSDADFHANEWGYEFTEGAAWHYSASATCDPQGMANLYGGRPEFSNKLDSVFAASRAYNIGSYGQVIHEMREAFEANLGQYAHSNEPIHSLIYMYDYANAPGKAQRHVREVLERLYDSGVGTGRGYLGDEDNGQMSAWYLFSALGFYPASPGHPEYALGSPLFKKAVIHLENGNQFVVSAPSNSSGNVFIQSAKLNGADYSKPYLSHSDIMAGGLLELTMGASQSFWGTRDQDLPNSITPVSSARIPTMRVDRAVGGIITASSDNIAGNAAKDAAFDDDSQTQWQALETAPSIQYAFASDRKYTVGLYTLTSAADAPERDPRDWQLQASNNCATDSALWVTIDRRSGEDFVWRRYTRVFSADNRTPYACYRLSIEANHGGDATQLAEIELIGDAPIESAQAQAEAGCDTDTSSIRATDGSLFTKWCSEATLPQLIIDLGNHFLVDQLTVYHAGAGGEPALLNTQAFNIELSSDATNWARVIDVADNQDDTTQHTVVPTEARYVKLIVTKPNAGTDSKARIYEIDVYGQTAP